MLLDGVTVVLGTEPGADFLTAVAHLMMLATIFFGVPCATFARDAMLPKDRLTRTPEMYLHAYATCFEL